MTDDRLRATYICHLGSIIGHPNEPRASSASRWSGLNRRPAHYECVVLPRCSLPTWQKLAFGERAIAGITTGELDKWLRGLGLQPATRNSIRLRLGVLFSYAIGEGWCHENPVRKVKKVKASSTPEILSPEEFAKLLETASEETLPYWLVGGFAGLRRAEIERLHWKDIHFDVSKYRAFIQAQALTGGDKETIENAEKDKEAWRQSALIEVPALKAKTASRRFVQIQDSLAAWLEPFIGRTGPVCPPNLRKRPIAQTPGFGVDQRTRQRKRQRRSGRPAS